MLSDEWGVIYLIGYYVNKKDFIEVSQPCTSESEAINIVRELNNNTKQKNFTYKEMVVKMKE